MGLRKSPERTPAFLAAQRRNARKCTGPKTPQGKTRASLNSLKHGRRAHNLSAKVSDAGLRLDAHALRKIRDNYRLLLGGTKAADVAARRSVNREALRVWSEHQVQPPLLRAISDGMLAGRWRN